MSRAPRKKCAVIWGIPVQTKAMGSSDVDRLGPLVSPLQTSILEGRLINDTSVRRTKDFVPVILVRVFARIDSSF